jgi:hypothetical protein
VTAARRRQLKTESDEDESRHLAFGPMITRFVPLGYRPEHDHELVYAALGAAA